MIANQLYMFILFFICGIVISIIYDLFRSIRLLIKTSNTISSLEDFIYIIIVGIVFITFLRKYNYGQIRLFIPVALTIGCIIYFMFFSKTIIIVNTTILNLIKKLMIRIKETLMPIIEKTEKLCMKVAKKVKKIKK